MGEVYEEDVPRGIRIYRLKWAHSMKKDAETEMMKFAPRLCLVDTNMDSDVYPSFSEVSNPVSLNIMGAIYVAHMESFHTEQDDDGDAFQNTIIDGSDGREPSQPLYTYQSPGF